jgi:galactan endo-1,6-beta-galactosidase
VGGRVTGRGMSERIVTTAVHKREVLRRQRDVCAIVSFTHSPTMRTPTLIKAAFVLASSASVNADVTTTIDPKSNWGTWEGWGTSLAWWAQEFGNRDDLADVFFTLSQTKVNGQSLPGLGFNIVRYNAGACSWNTVDGEKMVVSPNVKRSRQMEGYWIDWKDKNPQSASWNWYDHLFWTYLEWPC